MIEVVVDLMGDRKVMITPTLVAETETLVLGFSKSDRVRIVSKLIASLGSPFDHDEDIVELAARRDQEADEQPETIISEDELWASIKEYRRK